MEQNANDFSLLDEKGTGPSTSRSVRRQARRDQGAELAARKSSRRAAPATETQLVAIQQLLQDVALYEAEFVAILDTYGARRVEDLTETSASYVISALEERRNG